MRFRTLVLVFCLIVPLIPVSAQMPAPLLEDLSKYYGYDYGCAGIVSSLISALPFLDPSLLNRTIDTVGNCLDALWDSRMSYDGEIFAAWAKSTENDIIYPGHKYGAAGIIETFLDFYEMSGNQTWLQRAIESYSSLMNQAINKTSLPHWGYAYDLPNDPYAIPITDIKYGAAGILKLNLRLYKITNNVTLLTEGERIIEWLKTTTRLINIDGINYNVIGWYLLENSDAPIVSAYEYGLAGLAPLLYDYGMVLESQTIKNFAREQILYLKSIQYVNGSWPYSTQDPSIIVGFDKGIAGILYGFLEMKNLMQTNEYDETIRKGISYLFDNLIDNSTHFGWISSNIDPIIYNNLAQGLSGILLVLNALDEFLSEEDRSLVLKGIEFLLGTQTLVLQNNGEKAILLKNPWLNEGYFDLSYADGLAGLLKFLTLINQTYSDFLSFNLTSPIRYAVSTFLMLQGDDGLWNKQRDLSPLLDSFDSFTEGKSSPSIPSETKDASFPLSFLFVLFVFSSRKNFLQKNIRI